MRRLSEERGSVLADLESVTADLRRAVVAAVTSGKLTEVDAHKITGCSRTTIRVWLGKQT